MTRVAFLRRCTTHIRQDKDNLFDLNSLGNTGSKGHRSRCLGNLRERMVNLSFRKCRPMGYNACTSFSATPWAFLLGLGSLHFQFSPPSCECTIEWPHSRSYSQGNTPPGLPGQPDIGKIATPPNSSDRDKNLTHPLYPHRQKCSIRFSFSGSIDKLLATISAPMFRKKVGRRATEAFAVPEIQN